MRILRFLRVRIMFLVDQLSTAGPVASALTYFSAADPSANFRPELGVRTIHVCVLIRGLGASVMQFGLYLKHKGVISADQLVDALEIQHRRLVPIGQIAMEECIISARDVFKVLHAQSDMPHEKFGDLAVDMGFMTRQQLERVLVLQSDRKPSLVDVLVHMGVISVCRAETELAAYRREMERKNVVVTRPIRTKSQIAKPDSRTDMVESESYAMMI
jgi:hypothetical protein